jgi:hypothetical protein
MVLRPLETKISIRVHHSELMQGSQSCPVSLKMTCGDFPRKERDFYVGTAPRPVLDGSEGWDRSNLMRIVRRRI